MVTFLLVCCCLLTLYIFICSLFYLFHNVGMNLGFGWLGKSRVHISWCPNVSKSIVLLMSLSVWRCSSWVCHAIGGLEEFWLHHIFKTQRQLECYFNIIHFTHRAHFVKQLVQVQNFGLNNDRKLSRVFFYASLWRRGVIAADFARFVLHSGRLVLSELWMAWIACKQVKIIDQKMTRLRPLGG